MEQLVQLRITRMARMGMKIFRKKSGPGFRFLFVTFVSFVVKTGFQAENRDFGSKMGRTCHTKGVNLSRREA